MQTFMYFESIADYNKIQIKTKIMEKRYFAHFLYWDKAQSMKPWPCRHEVLS